MNGRSRATLDDLAGVAAGQLLLAVLLEDPAQLELAVLGDYLGGGDAAGGVHPHVERGVLGVGEAALGEVELHRGDAEVEQDAGHSIGGVLGGDLADLVVDGMHADESIPEAGESGAGELEGTGVAVDADEPGVGEAAEHRFGVAAEAEGSIDQDRDDAGGCDVLDAGRQQLERALEQDGRVQRGVLRSLFHDLQDPSRSIPIRSIDLTPGKCVKAIDRLEVVREGEGRAHPCA